MDILAYLNRINYTTKVEIDKQTLFGLQKAHLLSVPFENLDIHYKQPIVLDKDLLFKKIVIHGRGGFCYELNGLFFELLKAIGFNVHLISARVHDKNGVYGKEHDHMAILANLGNEKFLVDVGFGKFSLEPLTLIFKELQSDRFGTFVFDIHEKETEYVRVSEVHDNTYTPQYIFHPQRRTLTDFEAMCTYHQTSTNSHFTKKKVISVSTPNGRITLNNDRIKITEGEETKEIQFNESEFELFLKNYFDINLSIGI